MLGMWENWDKGTHSWASLQVLFWYSHHTANRSSEVLTAEFIFLFFLWMEHSLCFFHSWRCIIWYSIKSLDENVYKVQPGEVATLLMSLFASHSPVLALWEKVPLCPSLFTGHQNKSDNIDSFKRTTFQRTVGKRSMGVCTLTKTSPLSSNYISCFLWCLHPQTIAAISGKQWQAPSEKLCLTSACMSVFYTAMIFCCWV